MCTVVLLRRPGHPWPLLIAANRDEMADRPWQAPGRHWRDRPHVIGGLDSLGRGTWLGTNAAGVVAAVLNRVNTLGPAPGRRSRGELPLLALEHDRAAAAARALSQLDVGAYRGFNLIVADGEQAFCLMWDEAGTAALAVDVIPPGLSMVTAYDRNDLRSPRIRRYLQRFATSPAPQPEVGDWRGWIALLSATDADPGSGPGGAMTVITPTGFGTVCSSLLALPARGAQLWLFADGRPGERAFRPVPAR